MCLRLITASTLLPFLCEKESFDHDRASLVVICHAYVSTHLSRDEATCFKLNVLNLRRVASSTPETGWGDGQKI